MKARVYLIPIACLAALLRGEKRILNLPGDAEIVSAACGLQGFGVRVHSESFQEVPAGAQLPIIPAVLEKKP